MLFGAVVPRRFQSKLLLYAAVVVTLPLLLAALLIREDAVAARREIELSHLAAARGAAAAVDDFLIRRLGALSALSFRPELWSDDPAELEPMLNRAIIQQEGLLWVAVTTVDGAVVGTGLTLDAVGTPKYVGDREWFQAVLASGQPVVATLSTATDRPGSVAIVIPMRGERGVIGRILVARASLRPLGEVALQRVAGVAGPALLVTDENGLPLVHEAWPAHLTQHGLAGLPPIRAALARGTGILDYRDEIDGSVWHAGYAGPSQVHWAVAVARPTGQIPRLWLGQRGGWVAALPLVGISALIVAVFLARKLTAPLRDLTAEAAAIAGTPRGARIQRDRSADELQQLGAVIGDLSATLTHNAEDLARSRHELEHQARQLRSLIARVASSREEERRRIASDIHDGVTQVIVGARHELHAGRRALDRGQSETATARLSRAEGLLDDAHGELHRVVFALRPKVLEEQGLVHAVERYVHQIDDTGPVGCELRINGMARGLAPDIELSVFRLIQEATNNARRHAHASRVVVELLFTDDPPGLVASVADDGVGFDPDSIDVAEGHLGLVGMRERAAAVGGALAIASTPGRGTRIELRVQTDDPQEDERPIDLAMATVWSVPRPS